MKILGLDPGKSTGYALIETKNRIILPTEHMGIEKNEQVTIISDLIDQTDIVVCEDFKLDPRKARDQNWSNMVASRVIGKIELLCQMKDINLVFQRPAEKPAAYGFAGMKYRKGKQGMHFHDAFAHAVFYAVTKQHCLPVKKKN